MATGELLTSGTIGSGQNAIWFGGGLTAVAVDGSPVNTVDDQNFSTTAYLTTGLVSTGNKSTPTLKADIFGHWREEIILTDSQNRPAIVTGLAPTEYGIRTLMHAPMYRNGVANKNIGYDQVGFASFYLGDEAALPPVRTDILVPAAPDRTPPEVTMKPNLKDSDQGYRKVYFQFADAGRIDKIVLNGVTTYLKNRTRTHLNGVEPCAHGAVIGTNVLAVYDEAGNITTVTFTLLNTKRANRTR